jgi:peptidoglycan/LPS O-acetylase OafA/YrhL
MEMRMLAGPSGLLEDMLVSRLFRPKLNMFGRSDWVSASSVTPDIGSNRISLQGGAIPRPATGLSPKQAELVASSNPYRADVDGLRAIAIMVVVFYHTGLPGFNGGFVGVDIFFVISGFLITNLVKAGLDKGTFRLSGFYERRMRRLAPALIVVLLASYGVAFLYFTQLDFELFSKSVVATSSFLSNVYFMRSGNYFAVDSAFKPLLHTWSLAVEEQFYLLYPVLLFALLRWCKSWTFAIIVVFFLVSLMGSAFGVVYAPEQTFYLLPGRAWELLLGAALSLRLMAIRADRLIREIMACVGAALIAVAVCLLTSRSLFPGWNALLPCVGAALIIWANVDKTFLARVLAHPYIVFIGLISYSLYLWHWPIITFYKYIVNERMSASDTGIVILLSVLVAALCWKFVEQPFRRRSNGFSKRGIFLMTGGATACVAVLGLWGGLSQGLPQRLSDQAVRYGSARWDSNPQASNCAEKSPNRVLEGHFCTVGNGDPEQPDFLVWGDSHADVWMPVFDTMARQRNLMGWFAVHAGCPSILGIKLLGKSPFHKCQEFNEAVARAIAHKSIHDVVLISRWSLYVYGDEVPDNEKRGNPDPIIVPADADNGSESVEAKKIVFERGVKETIKFLTSHRVKTWIFDEVPLQTTNIPNYLARNAIRGRTSEGRLRSEVFAREEFARAVFDRANSSFTRHIDPVAMLCPDNELRCHIEADGKSLYTDHNHLSVFGSWTLRQLLLPMFDEISGDVERR